MKRLSMKMILKKQPDVVDKEPDFKVKEKKKSKKVPIILTIVISILSS